MPYTVPHPRMIWLTGTEPILQSERIPAGKLTRKESVRNHVVQGGIELIS